MFFEFEGVIGEELIIQRDNGIYTASFIFTHKEGKERFKFIDVYDVVDSGHLIDAKKLWISNSFLNGQKVSDFVVSVEHSFLVEIEFRAYEQES